MNVSEAGVALIASFEGFSPTPYNDPAGHCTVGYGELLHLGSCTTAELARPPMTEEEGYAALRRKIQPYAVAVEGMTRPLNQNEFDALVSLCYNIGPGGYLNSGVRTAVNNGGDVCFELNKIIHGTDGVAYPGLIRRRKAECALFYTPVEEEDMKSFLAWSNGATYFVGPNGCRWITQQSVVDELAKVYGPLTVSLSAEAINAIGLAK